MKRFAFPLDRVMGWRRTQAHIEESKLERLHAEMRAIESRTAEVLNEREHSEAQIVAAGSATGMELAALDSFKKASVAECARLADAAADARKRIAAQLQVVTQKRRDLRLLENLRDRKLRAWKSELDREIDREASELYLTLLAARIK